MKTTGLFSIGWNDFGKGILIAILTVVLSSVYTLLQAGTLPTGADLAKIGIAALSAGIGYIIKNFFTNSENKLAKPEPK